MYARCAKQMTNVKLLFSLLRLFSPKERTLLAIDGVTKSRHILITYSLRTCHALADRME